MKPGLYYEPKRPKHWIVRWHSQYDPHTGTSHWYSKAFALKVEAQQFLLQRQQEQVDGIQQKPEPLQLGEFCSKWLSTRTELRENTKDLYLRLFKRLEAYYGAFAELNSITPQRAAEFIAAQKIVAKNGAGRALSAWSLEQVKRASRAVFEGAKEWQLVRSNPFKSLKSRRPPVHKWHYISMNEYQSLIDVTKNLQRKCFYSVAYFCGLRLSELLSLTWDCIDFEHSRLTLVNRKGTPEAPPFLLKDYEQRSIPIPKHTLDLLVAWHDQAPVKVPFVFLSAARYEIVKRKWAECRKAGKPWRNGYLANNLRREFLRDCKRSGLKATGKLCIHVLRKSCAQNLADNLPVALTKSILGHASVSTTLAHYNQIMPTHEQQALEVMQNLYEKSIAQDKAQKAEQATDEPSPK
ncbi:MAG: hypothetical protein A2Y12_04310 [Planctomycetes bacterium GWF2_42_9]|nr:MAG: hypothetical protein A2Y12_04310 [Planctomycetes bacterium GWF2_42_9]